MSERGKQSGKTLRMVQGIPATGSVIIVHNEQMKRYVEDMIRDLHGSVVLAATKVVVVRYSEDAEYHLTGQRVPAFIDHAFTDKARNDVRAKVKRLADELNVMWPANESECR